MKVKIIFSVCFILFLCKNSQCQNFFFLNNTDAVAQYYSSGSYDTEMRGVIAPAIEHFKNLTAAPNDVFVFDVDETSLSNFEIFKASDFVFNDTLYSEGVINEKETAVLPVLELYKVLVQRGYKIFFITGRDYSEPYYTHTVGNLKKVGYTQIDTLILRPEKFKNSTAQEYKSAIRAELVKAGYNLIGNAGDQWSDMAGGNAGYMVRVTNYMYCIK